ncbi:MAG: hypothetical protein ACK4WK_11590, partial [Anaerolineae bacterium]
GRDIYPFLTSECSTSRVGERQVVLRCNNQWVEIDVANPTTYTVYSVPPEVIEQPSARLPRKRVGEYFVAEGHPVYTSTPEGDFYLYPLFSLHAPLGVSGPVTVTDHVTVSVPPPSFYPESWYAGRKVYFPYQQEQTVRWQVATLDENGQFSVQSSLPITIPQDTVFGHFIPLPDSALVFAYRIGGETKAIVRADSSGNEIWRWEGGNVHVGNSFASDKYIVKWDERYSFPGPTITRCLSIWDTATGQPYTISPPMCYNYREGYSTASFLASMDALVFYNSKEPSRFSLWKIGGLPFRVFLPVVVRQSP